MSWLEQVAHVMSKDVRQARGLILLTLLTLAGATAQAMGWSVAGGELSTVGSSLSSLVRMVVTGPLPVVVGGLLVAVLVHADPPGRSDAFWTTRPLAPSAVVAAKLALGGLFVVLLPLAAGLIALLARDVSGGQIVHLLESSALLQAELLVGVAALAALTPDLRTLVVILVVTTLGWDLGVMAIRMAVAGMSVGISLTTPLVQRTAWLALSLGVVTYQYHARDAWRTVRVFALPAVVALAFMGISRDQRSMPHPFGPRVSSPEAVADVPTPEIIIAGDVRIEPAAYPGGPDWMAYIPVTLRETREGYRYHAGAFALRVHLPDGSESVFRSQNVEAQLLVPGGRAARDGYTWLGESGAPPKAAPGPLRTHIPVLLGEEGVDALRSGAPVSVEATVTVSEPETMGALPLRPGAATSRDGVRVRVGIVRPGQAGPAVVTSVESVGESGRVRGSDLWNRFEFALVNPKRREALDMISRGGGSGSDVPFVLMGTVARVYTQGLSPVRRPSNGPGTPVDELWLRDAELQVTDWSPVANLEVVSSPVPVRTEG